MDSSNLSNMVLRLEESNDNNVFEDEFYDFYMEGDSWDECEENEDFESSQLHQLVHTQPIHLINQQMLYGGDTTRERTLEGPASSRSSVSSTFEELGGFDNNVDINNSENTTAATSATSTHFKHNFYDMGEREWGLFKQQSQLYESGLHDMDWDVPRSFPFEYNDFSQCVALNTDHDAVPSHNYNYRFVTESSQTGRRPTEEENFFVKSLNSKLSRYTGYFGGGSSDQEYHDKVRFQEISYKFSKTYFWNVCDS